MRERATVSTPTDFLLGGGAMAERIRAFDWSTTPLGPPESWPQSLKTAAGMVLASKFPGCIVWGPALTTIYNDSFRPILGDKPEALGRPFSDVWREAWDVIGVIAKRALAGEATFIEDFPLTIERHGRPEEATFTFCYSPIRDETGAVAGFLDTVVETTAEVQRRGFLEEREERYRGLLEASSVVVWLADAAGMITYSRGWTDLTGQERNAYARTGWLDVVHPDDRTHVARVWQEALATKSFYQTEFRVAHVSGEYRWVLAGAVPLKDPDGSVREWVGSISDIHDRKQAEESLRASKEWLRMALHAGRMFAWEQDLDRDYIIRSENSIGLLGIGSGPVSELKKGMPPEDMVERDRFFREILAKGSALMEFRFVLPDGRTLWLGTRGEKSGPHHVVGVTFDITERKTAELEIWRSANHDPLTGLPNRILFHDRLERALADAQDDGGTVSLLLIDLDDFKDVNDTLGHDAGDMLLKETATRLTGLIGDRNLVARLGGDEFAVLVMDPPTLEDALRLADAVIARLREPFPYAGRMLMSRASIGVAAFPKHDNDPAELMKDADIALYRAKAQSRNHAVLYSPMMRMEIEARVALGRDIREALDNDLMVPFYQPKISLETGRIVGFEALARWRHPTVGFLTPAVFGPAFEDYELAAGIGRRIAACAAQDMRRWLDAGLAVGSMALNLSAAEFTQPTLADAILGILDAHRIAPRHFEVEITETVLLGRDPACLQALLEQFRRRGVQIALDDFGTGYASLTHLKQFPVSHIKIDRSFVANLERDVGDDAIVAAVIGLGRSLNLQVTAEGVETAGQARRLRELGCHNGQGYLYSRPMEAAQVPRFLAAFGQKRTG